MLKSYKQDWTKYFSNLFYSILTVYKPWYTRLQTKLTYLGFLTTVQIVLRILVCLLRSKVLNDLSSIYDISKPCDTRTTMTHLHVVDEKSNNGKCCFILLFVKPEKSLKHFHSGNLIAYRVTRNSTIFEWLYLIFINAWYTFLLKRSTISQRDNISAKPLNVIF
jgi:hypothetical protein